MAQQNNSNVAMEVRQMLNTPAVKKELAMALPSHLSPDRLLRVSLSVIRQNPDLLKCTQSSLAACVMGCAQLGLEPEPFLGQAYLVPFWNKHKKCHEAQLIPGYRGYITLARRSGEVQTVQAHVVYEGDDFELEYGLDPRLVHRPSEESGRGNPRGAYCVFKYKDGSFSFDYMSTSEIESIRNRSKAKESGPWVTDWDEMAKKTVIRRHVKLVPLSIELAQAVAADNMSAAAESQKSLFDPEQTFVQEQGQEVSSGNDEFAGTEEDFAAKVSQNNLDAKQVDDFVKETAKAQDAQPSAVKIYAAVHWDAFIESFNAWLNK